MERKLLYLAAAVILCLSLVALIFFPIFVDVQIEASYVVIARVVGMIGALFAAGGAMTIWFDVSK